MRQLLFGLLCILLSILIIFNCVRFGFQGDDFYPLRTEELFDRISRIDVDLREPFADFIYNVSDMFDILEKAVKDLRKALQEFNPNWKQNHNSGPGFGYGNVKEPIDFSISTLGNMLYAGLRLIIVCIVGIPCFAFAMLFAVLDVGLVLLNSVFVVLELVLELIGVSINFEPLEEFDFSSFFEIFKTALTYLVYT